MKGREKVYISVKVQPRARERKLEEVGPAEFRVSVLSPPAQGKANREVIEMLASAFALPKSGVNIIKGEKSRRKVVCLEVEDRNALILKPLKDKENSVED